MSIISKDDSNGQKKDEAQQKDPQGNQSNEELVEQDPPMLTPWQKENLKYLKSQGDEPIWYSEKETAEELNSQEEDSSSATSENLSNHSSSKELDEEEQEKQSESKDIPLDEEALKREKIRKKKLIRRLTFLISIFTISALVIIYCLSPLSRLGKITVKGNQNIASEKVIKDSALKLDKDLWEQYFARKKNSSSIVNKNPIVKKATIHFSLINHLVITIQEHQKIAYMLKDGQYYPILDNGETLQDPIGQPSGNLLILSDFNDKKILKEMIQSYNHLPDEIKTSISDILYKPSSANPYLITLNMNDGNQVIASIKDLDKKMGYYPQVIKDMDNKGIVDMEAGIYSYNYSSEENSTTESSTIENFNE